MEKVEAGTILKVKTGKYDANHAKENGNYQFFTCALVPFWTDTYSFDDEVIILPGNGANVGGVLYYKGKLEAYQRTYILYEINANVRYLYYYFKKYWIRQITKKQVGSATNYIKMDDILSFEIPLPSIATQQRIAAILDQADAIIQNNRAIVQKYDALTQSLFLDMFGDPVKNEKGWEKKEFKSFGKISTGNTPSRADAKNYDNDYIEWIKTDNIIENQFHISKAQEYLSFEGAKKGRIVKENSLLVTCIAGSLQSIGRAGISNRKIAFNQQINAIEPNDNVNISFLYFLVKNSRKYIQDHASSGMKRMLSKGEFEKIKMILPPITLQNQFAERVAVIEAQKQQAQLELAKSEELFASLLQRAFNGELN